MKIILVATDFSPAAFNAANYAADMALAINADMVLLHVFQIPVTYSEIPLAMNEQDMRQSLEKNVNELRERLIRDKKETLHIKTLVRMGTFFNELKAVCEEIHPYAVVMGSQGTTASERFFFGGHTVYATKNLMWPVITVPIGAKFLAIKKIGLACDFDKVMDTIPVQEIKLLIHDFNATLHILNTGRHNVYDPEIVFESELLQKMLNALKPKYHFITHENTDEGIINFAGENHIDLLIVLPKRHGLLDRFLYQSHTTQLVLHSHVPVMALHQ